MNKPAAARITAFVITAILIVASFCVAANAASARTTGLEHAGAAAAYGHDLGHPHAKRTRNAHKTHEHVKAHKAQATTQNPTQNPTTNPTQNHTLNPTQPATHVPALMEADDQDCTPQNVVKFLQAHNATVLRMVITPVHLASQDGLACIQTARAAGYKIYLSVLYDAGQSNARTVAYFQQVLATYGTPWAMSVGNEEGTAQDGNTYSPTAAQYLATWDAVEPVIPSGTLKVVGEADPWEAGWLTDVMDANPVGAAAASFHCYLTTGGGLADVQTLAQAAQQDGLPLWCSEMAPAPSSSAPSFFAQQTVASFNADVRQTIGASPDVQLSSWYEWPSIGAVTPGID